MRNIALTEVNLNLLVALDALLEERNVTRAAGRVGLSQSAMSHALKQLRDLFDDPLLVRGGGGLVLTPRAEELAPRVRRGLEELSQALRLEPAFEPSTARRRFTLVVGDYLGLMLFPPLLEIIHREAPGIDLEVRSGSPDLLVSALEKGEVDLGTTVALEEAPDIARQVILSESFACLVRRDHPVVQGTLDLETYVRLPHVLVSPQGRGPSNVDLELMKRGLTRRVMLRVPYFLIAPLVVARSDLVLTVPRRIAIEFVRTYPLQMLEPPIELARFSMLQVWHERMRRDPAHRWLRDAVVRALRKVGEEPPLTAGRS